MATILLVEDIPDLATFEARLLEAAGHRIIRCSGGPAVFGVCPLMRGDDCGIAAPADLILFACRLFAPMPRRSYRGIHLLRAYRSHPVYGRLPFVVVSAGDPGGLEGLGPIEILPKGADPAAVIRSVTRMLGASGHPAAEIVQR